MIDMRDSEPPEKVLKKSRTLPLVVSNRVASERGSMPGSGTNESSRNTTRAPRVNQRRFLRSVAFAKLARLRLEAICSAADAMGVVFLGKTKGGGSSLAPAASYRDRLRFVSLRPACARGSVFALLDAVLLRRRFLGRRNPLDDFDGAAGGSV